MYRVIIFLGIFLALIGVGAIAAGAPSWALGLGLGSSLIQSGSIGLVGGFLLVGIGFVLRALQDLSSRIDLAVSGPVASRPAASLRWYLSATIWTTRCLPRTRRMTSSRIVHAAALGLRQPIPGRLSIPGRTSVRALPRPSRA